MTKLSIAFLAACLFTVAIPAAIADETKADCEDTQPWIGYTSTTSVRDFVDAFMEGVRPGSEADVCEGEQWDGQDTVQPEESGANSPPCNEGPFQTADGGLFVSNCMDADPETQGEYAGLGLNAVRARASTSNLQEGSKEAYVALDIFAVGRVIVYSGFCQSGDGEGLEGAESCDGARQGRNAVYVRDNTKQVLPVDALATAVSAPGITKGYVAEADCDQETYQKGAETNDRTLCGRDNTAITAQWILP